VSRLAPLLVLLALTGCGSDPLPAFQQPPDKPAGPTPAGETGRSERVRAVLVTEGLAAATALAARPGDPGAVYVAEQTGLVRRVTLDGRAAEEPLLDVRARTRAGGELGLLGLAFHPRDGDRAFLHFTTPAMDTRVVEVDVRTGRERTLLEVDQPRDYENHKGGQLAFDRAGRLHVALGDGGSAFNPYNTAQDPETPFGKLLRFDGRSWDPVALGLRNPWRFSFDRVTGRLWVGDVGQDRIEEVNAVDLGDGPPPNFGWAAYEGHLPVGRKPLRDAGVLTWPVAAYDHDTGCSVTGGVVYRGERIPRLRGRFLFADFCRGTLWTMDAARPRERPDVRRERAKLPQVTAFGEDAAGEVYAVTAGGRLYALRAAR
jgi:glucose/arabinose dehydrogenase